MFCFFLALPYGLWIDGVHRRQNILGESRNMRYLEEDAMRNNAMVRDCFLNL
jgi:hypothetical protein